MIAQIYIISRSAHRTPNFTNPEFQFLQFKVLQSVFLFLFNITSDIGILGYFDSNLKLYLEKILNK